MIKKIKNISIYNKKIKCKVSKLVNWKTKFNIKEFNYKIKKKMIKFKIMQFKK